MTQQQKASSIIKDGNKNNNYLTLFTRKKANVILSLFVYTLMLPLSPASQRKARRLCLKLDVMLFNVSEQVYNECTGFTDVVCKFHYQQFKMIFLN